MLKLYNTLTKRIEEVPKKHHLNLYTCGPTVYNHAHIGNLRSFIMADLLYRTLKMDGYNPRWVMNVTDVDDKTIRGTIERYGQFSTTADLQKFTEHYFDKFVKDLQNVNVSVDELRFIRVSEVIPQIQQFITELMDKKYAYKTDDGVFFSIEQYQQNFGDYGQLVGEKFLEGKKIGARVKVDEYEKNNLSDFALWKAWDKTADAQIYWDDPVLGKGRPGWHIECSVINCVAFGGEPTDIHTGGIDLIFPHHTNEIAQSQALLGKGNFVKSWLHSEHLLVDGKKMAKRDNNFYVLSDLEPKAALVPWSLRNLFLQSHYRTQQNFTDEALQAASNGVANFINSVRDNVGQPRDLDVTSLNDDLNSAKAIAENSAAAVLECLIGIQPSDIIQESPLSPEIQALADERQHARQQKNFAKSDELRKQIEAAGYEVMDNPDGQKIRPLP